MAQEAINIIKKTEEDAKNIIINSEQKAAQIVNDAKKHQKTTENNLSIELKQKYDEAISAAKNTADTQSKENTLVAQKEAEELKTNLMSKKQKAIDSVLKRILEG